MSRAVPNTPQVGERWGAFLIIEELPPRQVRQASEAERMFKARCLCGAVHVLPQLEIKVRDERITLSCSACRAKVVSTPRFPDGIFGNRKIVEKLYHNGITKWRLQCLTCGAECLEDGLRERRINEECISCRNRRLRAEAKGPAK